MSGSRTIVVAVLLGTLLTGCRTPSSYPNKDRPGAVLVPEQFPFLPVPVDFELKTSVNQSYTYRRGDYRFGHLEYRGPGKIAEVRDTLKKQLRTHGWTMYLEEIPKGPRVEQKWSNRSIDGVRYTLTAVLDAEGTGLGLSYELRTQRLSRADMASDAGTAGAQPVDAVHDSGKQHP
ncbi:MAG: hypothetical protein R3F30_00990 [Planctomycetota bacterium]